MHEYIQTVDLSFLWAVIGIRELYLQYIMYQHLTLKLTFTKIWKSVDYECIPGSLSGQVMRYGDI